ncbi:MAG: glutamine--tRNA ligase/YqeY domain fusion protein [Deltaproteobacteria bacterium]|nr:glutamine--tRNA ligase/YqeY domain fusion protein [Deltaproteobacteria bacterium]
METKRSSNFIRQIIDEDLRTGKHKQIITRFPPEPNGYLHVGHAKALCVNFGIAEDYPGAYCNLRFDDTNPLKEDLHFIEAIQDDISWMGFQWHGDIKYASAYFDKLHDYAVQLIKMGKAYVCRLSTDEMKTYRGTLTEPGKESPDRNRSIEENLAMFEKMRDGVYDEGSYTLRAKIDMNSGNVNMRDPVIYRILKATHPMLGNKWVIYPMYDYTHCLSDSLEYITHSLCTLEFQDHRPLYDWFIDTLRCESHPQQIEFARLNVNYTVTSKRKLRALVENKLVDAWDDPRMPTLKGMRRRGYTPSAIKDFCERVGVTKKETTIDISLLEECVREDLNKNALRAFCVLDPLKLVIENYPQGKKEQVSAPNHPQNPDMGSRPLPFSRDIYIERDDFAEVPPKGYFRLSPGQEVRLRYAYIIRCEKVVKDASGKVTELRCSYDPDTLGKNPVGRKVKGVIHWVSAADAVPAVVRLYDRLFTVPDPTEKEKDGIPYTDFFNPHSLERRDHAIVEASLRNAAPETHFQFERLGYFTVDRDSRDKPLTFNRTVSLRETR